MSATTPTRSNPTAAVKLWLGLRTALSACEELTEALEGHDCADHKDGTQYCLACHLLSVAEGAPFTLLMVATSVEAEFRGNPEGDGVLDQVEDYLDALLDPPEPAAVVGEVE